MTQFHLFVYTKMKINFQVATWSLTAYKLKAEIRIWSGLNRPSRLKIIA